MANTNNAKSGRFVTPIFRASYAQVYELAADKLNPQKAPTCSVTMIFDKKTTDFTGLKNLIKEAIAKGKDTKWGGVVPPANKLKIPLRDGSEKSQDGYGPDTIFAAARCYCVPQVLAADGKTLLSTEAEFGSGDYARATITAKPFNQNGNVGVRFELGNIQKVKDGPRFNGSRPAEDEFDALEQPADGLSGETGEAPAGTAAAPAQNDDPLAGLGV
jgi:hypothetical protein